jgi:hypothetical protein
MGSRVMALERASRLFWPCLHNSSFILWLDFYQTCTQLLQPLSSCWQVSYPGSYGPSCCTWIFTWKLNVGYFLIFLHHTCKLYCLWQYGHDETKFFSSRLLWQHGHDEAKITLNGVTSLFVLGFLTRKLNIGQTFAINIISTNLYYLWQQGHVDAKLFRSRSLLVEFNSFLYLDIDTKTYCWL